MNVFVLDKYDKRCSEIVEELKPLLGEKIWKCIESQNIDDVNIGWAASETLDLTIHQRVKLMEYIIGRDIPRGTWVYILEQGWGQNFSRTHHK